jgi:intracellular sulfur oxidation DsrE/DsrF family protein
MFCHFSIERNSFKNIFNQAANVIQYNYYESYINKEEGGTGYITVKDRTKPKQDDEAAHKPKDPKIMALVGAAAGFFLGFVVLLLIMIFGGRLQKAEELGTLFDLKLVGTILTNTFELPFEKAVKYFRTRRYGAFNTDKNIKLTAMKLKAMCEAENTKKIVLTGTAATKTNKKVLDTLKAELEKQGIEVAACGNLLASPQTFEELIKVKTAVFVEREVRSAYKNIEHEQMMAGGCGIKILGAICIY